MTIELHGNWEKGFALDLQTTSSTYLGIDEFGHKQFDTKRPEIGEWVYKLKYKNDVSVVPKIVTKIQENISEIDKLDAIISIPPSNTTRSHQPVYLVGKALSKTVGIPFFKDSLIKTGSNEELKNIQDPSGRTKKLRQSMQLTKNYDLQGKSVLLLDDLYRSGATLMVATEILMTQAKVSRVYVLTLTKTRSNR
ncbi:MAG: ComF family protein [Candidatus Marinimicrobia bacterium]|nr:ComF family protein [Candidatus Neomarinimicrobiota bacterium]